MYVRLEQTCLIFISGFHDFQGFVNPTTELAEPFIASMVIKEWNSLPSCTAEIDLEKLSSINFLIKLEQ